MNADYKILAYVLTTQLTVHLTDVIAVNQTAYMKGWFIGTNIHSVQDTLNHFFEHSLSCLILFLDFKKAFNSVSHEFLFMLLAHIGFPSEFLQWVQIMYTDAMSMVWYKNWLTSEVLLGRGVCQGQTCWTGTYHSPERLEIFSLVAKEWRSLFSLCWQYCYFYRESIAACWYHWEH